MKTVTSVYSAPQLLDPFYGKKHRDAPKKGGGGGSGSGVSRAGSAASRAQEGGAPPADGASPQQQVRDEMAMTGH
eukprot:3706318-Prymnesium_polylepis.1